MKGIFNTEATADPSTPLTPDIPLQESRGHTALKKAPGDCKEALTPEQNRRLAQAMMAFTTDLFSLVAQRSTSPNLILSHVALKNKKQILKKGKMRKKGHFLKLRTVVSLKQMKANILLKVFHHLGQPNLLLPLYPRIQLQWVNRGLNLLQMDVSLFYSDYPFLHR